MKKTFIREIPFHPILWGFLPLLIFYVVNISEVSIKNVWRSLGLSVFFALLVFGMMKLFFKNWHKSALMASWSLFLFFMYGHVYSLLKNEELFGILLGRHRLLISLWLIFLAIGSILIIRKKNNFKFWTLFLNLMLLSGIILQAFQVGIYFYNRKTTNVEVSADIDLHYDRSEPLPDVYLIILDAYPRPDVSKNHYDFDDSGFIEELEELDFEIVPCARGNYEHTAVAIPSLLNMDYLHVLSEDLDAHIARELLVKNRVRQMFGELGYQFIAYETQYPWLTFRDADVFFDFETTSRFNFLQPFELMFLETTGGLIFSDLAATRVQSIISDLNITSKHALRAYTELSNIEALDHTIDIMGPKFVYAHFMSTHPPFVLDAEGNIMENLEESDSAYVNSAKFISSQISNIVQKIIDDSKVDPVVIIQSDHGLNPEFRYTILNAIHFPEDRGELPIYPGMTPVNSFRMIFNQLFSTEYELLEDRYFESKANWFDLAEIKNVDPLCNVD